MLGYGTLGPGLLEVVVDQWIHGYVQGSRLVVGRHFLFRLGVFLSFFEGFATLNLTFLFELDLFLRFFDVFVGGIVPGERGFHLGFVADEIIDGQLELGLLLQPINLNGV